MHKTNRRRFDPDQKAEAGRILDGLAENFETAGRSRVVGLAETLYRRSYRPGDPSRVGPLIRLARSLRAASRSLESSALRHRDGLVLLTEVHRELSLFRNHKLHPRLMRVLTLAGHPRLDLDQALASLAAIIATRAPTSTGVGEEATLPLGDVDLRADPWRNLDSLRSRHHANEVTVIIPVYAGRMETLACIRSVLRARNDTPANLLVVDDQSPDQTLSQDLRTLADGGLLDLIRNPVNQGFVGSVNTGMLACQGDVVLLNSDTVVSDGWLDHLRHAADSRQDVGSISPLSNNATILSYPFINELNTLPSDANLRDLCAHLEAADSEELVEVPTTVGFCMFIPRRALREVGLFDEPAFGLGYGEESDWAMRARGLGFRHYATTRSFVFHHGSISFSATALTRQEAAGEVIRKRHPHYWPLVAQHIAEDPLAEVRRHLDAKRVQAAACGAPIVLHVLHSLGGGTDKHVQHVADSLAERGILSLFMQPDHHGSFRILSNFLDDVPNLAFNMVRDRADLEIKLREWNVAYIHVHNLIGYGRDIVDWLAEGEWPLVVTLHDYALICPNITLIDNQGLFCGAQPTTVCHQCISKKRPALDVANVGEWRARMQRLAGHAETVVSPSRTTAELYGRIWPDQPIAVVPHSEEKAGSVSPSRAQGGIVTVAVIGTIVEHKGGNVIADCVRDAEARKLPLMFAVCGEFPTAAEGPHLSISGRFSGDILPDMLTASGATIGFLPSVWPETYSYVLSEYFRHGLHPVVFDLGAQAERVRDAGTGTILPLRLSAGAINDTLLAIQPRGEPLQPMVNSEDAQLREIYPRLFAEPEQSAVAETRALPVPTPA